MIPLMSPDIREEDIKSVTSVLRSGMLVQGSYVQILEAEFKQFFGIKHAIAVANGTASLHLSLIALGIGRDDEVIVPAFSYIATANAVELVGATPVFVDIDISTFNIDVNKIKSAITKKTKAIMPVHEFGLAADIHKIKELSDKYGFLIIEDAACALGAIECGKYAGTFGNVGSFSLHPRKAITSGEGGVIITNDDVLAAKLKALRNHGIEMQNGRMEFVIPGFNYRMTDFQAALVSSQLKRLPDILFKKRKLAAVYQRKINHIGINKPVVPDGKKHTWQTYHLVLGHGIKRDDAIEYLKKQGVGANYGAQCMPAQQWFQAKYKLNCEKFFPNAMKAYRQGLAIPLYEKLNEDQVVFVAEQLNKIS